MRSPDTVNGHDGLEVEDGRFQDPQRRKKQQQKTHRTTKNHDFEAVTLNM